MIFATIVMKDKRRNWNQTSFSPRVTDFCAFCLSNGFFDVHLTAPKENSMNKARVEEGVDPHVAVEDMGHQA